MPTPTFSENSSPNQGNHDLRIHVFGHSSADPAGVAHAFGGLVDQDPKVDCDLAIFAINPTHGIDAQSISNWEELNESMVPRLVLVTGLDESEADFDDAVLLANRVFDQTVTPFLVLHDDAGLACALISLQNLQITDYSTLPPISRESDPEHQILVSEFHQEYLAHMELMGEDGFAAGLLFPAIPIWLDRHIGIDIVKKYLGLLP